MLDFKRQAFRICLIQVNGKLVALLTKPKFNLGCETERFRLASQALHQRRERLGQLQDIRLGSAM